MNSPNPNFKDDLGNLITEHLHNHYGKAQASTTGWQRLKQNLRENQAKQQPARSKQISFGSISSVMASLLVVFGFLFSISTDRISMDNGQYLARVSTFSQQPETSQSVPPEAVLTLSSDTSDIQKVKLSDRQQARLIALSQPESPDYVAIPSDVVPHPLSQLGRQIANAQADLETHENKKSAFDRQNPIR